MLKKFDITLTTSWEANHGISGHLFEMVEYFYHLTFHKNKSVCILIADGLSREQYSTALQKYDFTDDELKIINERTFFHYQPMALVANTLFVVNGSFRMSGAELMVNKKIVFRCNEDHFLENADIVLQDYDVYEPLPNSIHYKKKILFDKFKKLNPKNPDIGMFYATKNSRKIEYDQLQDIINKTKFSSYLLLTDRQMETPERCELRLVPINDLWDSFSTYLYTNASVYIDCSPRFVAECKHYGKDVQFHSTKVDKGLQIRMRDLETNAIDLKESDDLYSKI